MHRLPCDRYSLAKQCAPGFGNLLNLRHIVSQDSNKIYHRQTHGLFGGYEAIPDFSGKGADRAFEHGVHRLRRICFDNKLPHHAPVVVCRIIRLVQRLYKRFQVGCQFASRLDRPLSQQGTKGSSLVFLWQVSYCSKDTFQCFCGIFLHPQRHTLCGHPHRLPHFLLGLCCAGAFIQVCVHPVYRTGCHIHMNTHRQ